MTEFKSRTSYQDFAFSMRKWRYVRTSDDEDFVKALIATGLEKTQVIPAGSVLYRAQVGSKLAWVKDQWFDAPFGKDRMKPPKDWSIAGGGPEGRVNPKGIPCLYTATEKSIAIGEVRPDRGACVSVAKLSTTRDLRVLNCTTDEGKVKNIIYLKEPQGEERTLAVWRDIDRAFSAPVAASDDRAEYAPTQLIAELFRLEGCDGIGYRSSGGPGHNIALFDLDSAEIFDEMELVEVTNMTLEYSGRWPFSYANAM
jgi:hypothetical protein